MRTLFLLKLIWNMTLRWTAYTEVEKNVVSEFFDSQPLKNKNLNALSSLSFDFKLALIIKNKHN